MVDSLCHPDDLVVERPIRERIVREGGSGELELRMRDPNSNGWNHLKILLRGGRELSAGRHEVYGLTQRITELAWARDEAKAYADKVKALATTDGLTGVCNRMSFEEWLAGAVERNSRGEAPFALLSVDLDRFKEVNDTLGHAAGDELIREAAARLRMGRRPGDIVARLGGDEFAVLVNGADPHAAATAAQRIVDDLSGAVTLSAGSVTLSCSVGVTIIGEEGASMAKALSQADLALYRAKHLGRGRYCFYEPEMDAVLKERKALQSALRTSVRDDMLDVAYQPIVNARGEVKAVEALARWRHPERGMIPPAVFIPLAEEGGLIADLGRATLRRVCRDASSWPHLRVAINVSALELKREDFCGTLEASLREFSVDPSRVDIELTESCLLEDDARTQETLSAVRSLGCRLALDDFGTGFSSLSYLHRYPIDVIKLDRAFVARLDDGREAVAIVRAIAQLARALKLDMIAEGVETDVQWTKLKRMRLASFQGFLFSAPLSKDDFCAWLGAAQGVS